MFDADKAYDEGRQERISAGHPLKAPPCCAACEDETDCSHVLICRSVAEVFGEAVE